MSTGPAGAPGVITEGPLGRGRSVRPAPLVLWIVATLALAPAVVPFAFLIGRALGGGAKALDTVFSGRTAELILNTAGLVLAVSFSAAVIGVGAAWITERTDLPGRRWWRVAVALPLVLPSYVIALTVISALGPRGLLADAFGLALPTVRGFFGAWWALTVATYPFVYLIVGSALRRMDPAVEEAARGLGSSPRRVFWTVVVPQLREAIGAGVLLSALYALSDFGAVSLVGFDSFTRVVYAQYAGRLDRTPATVLAVVLVLLALVVLLVETRFRRGRPFIPRPTTRRVRVMALTKSQRIATGAGLTALGVFALGLPVSTLLAWVARHPAPDGIPWSSLSGSVSASLLAALAAVALAIPTAVLVVRHSSTATRWVERTAYLAYSIPHITAGLAVVFVASRYLGPLYQSLWVLVGVYTAIFFALALGAMRSALAQVSPSLEEASRGLGRGAIATLLRITLPLVWRGVAAGGLLVFLTTMKELPITLLARPTGFDTLAVDVWSAAGELLYSTAAVPALLLLAVSALPTYVLATRQR